MRAKVISFFSVIYSIYALIIFLITMFIVVPFVVIASFFGRIKGGNAIYVICNWWAKTWYFFIGIRHRNIYEAKHDKSKQYIFVANHISYIDAPIIVISFHQRIRVLGKAEISKIPVFGFIYRNAVVTVDRTNADARAKSVRTLKSVLKKGISIFLFPEGTFNETHQPLKAFFNGAFRIAIEMQTPIKPLLFLDGYNRMPYESALAMRPGQCRTVFLEEIPTAGLTMKDLDALREKVHKVMEEKLIEYGASWVGESGE